MFLNKLTSFYRARLKIDFLISFKAILFFNFFFEKFLNDHNEKQSYSPHISSLRLILLNPQTHLPSKFTFSSLLKNWLSPINALIMHGRRAIHWRAGNQPAAKCTRRTIFSPSSHQPLLAPQSGWALESSPTSNLHPVISAKGEVQLPFQLIQLVCVGLLLSCVVKTPVSHSAGLLGDRMSWEGQVH